MAVYDLYLLTNKDLSQDWEGAEYSGKSGASIDDPVRQMVDLDAVREVSDTRTCWRIVRVRDNYDTMASINQFLIWSALYMHMIHLSFGRMPCSLNHIQTKAGIYDFQHPLVVGKRNRISCYVRQRLCL